MDDESDESGDDFFNDLDAQTLPLRRQILDDLFTGENLYKWKLHGKLSQVKITWEIITGESYLQVKITFISQVWDQKWGLQDTRIFKK